MFTSNFARAGKLPPELSPVGIAVGPPRYWKGRVDKRLAPTRPMLKMGMEEYNQRFEEILAGQNAEQLYEELGENAVLLCWEPPHTSCHRRRVAEWFEEKLGIVVPEWGFSRDECLPYRMLPEHKKGGTTKAKPTKKKSTKPTGSVLFPLNDDYE